MQLGRMIDRYKQQINELESKLSSNSLNSFCLKQEFAKINAEKRHWHVDALQSKMRLELLRNRLKTKSEFLDSDIFDLFDKDVEFKEEDITLENNHIKEEKQEDQERQQILETSLKDREKTMITEEEKEKPQPKSILKAVNQENVIDLTIGDDDNDSIDKEVISVHEEASKENDENRRPKNVKNVNFSDNTVEPKETNRNRMQRFKVIVPDVVINQK